jgi:hypothetical protein
LFSCADTFFFQNNKEERTGIKKKGGEKKERSRGKNERTGRKKNKNKRTREGGRWKLFCFFGVGFNLFHGPLPNHLARLEVRTLVYG